MRSVRKGWASLDPETLNRIRAEVLTREPPGSGGLREQACSETQLDPLKLVSTHPSVKQNLSHCFALETVLLREASTFCLLKLEGTSLISVIKILLISICVFQKKRLAIVLSIWITKHLLIAYMSVASWNLLGLAPKRHYLCFNF